MSNNQSMIEKEKALVIILTAGLRIVLDAVVGDKLHSDAPKCSPPPNHKGE